MTLDGGGPEADLDVFYLLHYADRDPLRNRQSLILGGAGEDDCKLVPPEPVTVVYILPYGALYYISNLPQHPVTFDVVMLLDILIEAINGIPLFRHFATMFETSLPESRTIECEKLYPSLMP